MGMDRLCCVVLDGLVEVDGDGIISRLVEIE